jgi:hypothetical protein
MMMWLGNVIEGEYVTGWDVYVRGSLSAGIVIGERRGQGCIYDMML